MYPRPWSPAEYLSLVCSNGRQCRRRQFFPRKQPTVKRIPGSRSRSGVAGTNGAGRESTRAPEPRLASFIDGTEGCVLLEDKSRPPHAGLRGETQGCQERELVDSGHLAVRGAQPLVKTTVPLNVAN